TTLAFKARGSRGVDLKSTIIPHWLALLLVDVLVDHLIGNVAGRHCKVSPRPEMSSPILLLEMWELLEQHARTSTLEPLYDLADVLMRPIAEEHVHMVSRHLAQDDVQIVLSRNLPSKSRVRTATGPVRMRLRYFGTQTM